MKKNNLKTADETKAIDNPDVIMQPDLSTPEVKAYFSQAIAEKYQRLKDSELAQFNTKINSLLKIGGIEKYLERKDLEGIRNIPDLYATLHGRCLAKAETDVSLVSRLSHQGFEMQKWKGQYKEVSTDLKKYFEVGFRLINNRTHPAAVLCKHEFRYAETEKGMDVGALFISPDQSRLVIITNPSPDLNEHPRNYEIVIIHARDRSFKIYEKIVRFMIGFTKDGTQNFALFSSAGLELL